MKYDPASWSALLGELSKYLGSIYEEVGTWLGTAGTLEDADFDDWWLQWVRLENAGYEAVEDEEETYMAEEYPDIVRIHNEENWCRRNLMEAEYELFQKWLVDEGMVPVYDRFFKHLVSLRTAGEYRGPPVCTLRRF